MGVVSKRPIPIVGGVIPLGTLGIVVFVHNAVCRVQFVGFCSTSNVDVSALRVVAR